MSKRNTGKRKASVADSESSSEDERTMAEKVVDAIKSLEDFDEKVQTIALDKYTIEKRQIDDKLVVESRQTQFKYRQQYKHLIEEVQQILSGNMDLTDEDLEGTTHLLTEQENENKSNYYEKKEIQWYWFRSLMNSGPVAEFIEEPDEKLLKHIVKIDAERTEDGKWLTVSFFFSPNEWFTNEVIKKEFELYDDTTIKRSFGDSIDWKQGKNITVKTVKKRNKKKKTTTTKTVKLESFFHLFNGIDLSIEKSEDEDDENDKDDEENDNEVEELEKQYEICNIIYEEVLPSSLEFFLGVNGPLDLGDDVVKYLGIQGSDDEEVPDEIQVDDDDEGEKKQKKSKKSKSKSKPKAKKRKGSTSSK